MKFEITYMSLDDSGETVELNYNTIWADNVKYRVPIYSYINVRAKNSDKALEKAKIKLSKIGKKKKFNKYMINGIKAAKMNNFYVIGKVYNVQNPKIEWKYGE